MVAELGEDILGAGKTSWCIHCSLVLGSVFLCLIMILSTNLGSANSCSVIIKN